ncbi:hypothetical protein U9M48_014529 [Paspalum notatum var. saurae]|uniref:Uncharacterized protein n=1 Tax=Paspalum notatum var. saurae TaxID=547442 RepID=A0AAQ3WKT4_PASNO
MGEEVAVVLEPPRPKSPPRYPDLCGRRRLQLELQILNREIDFLKDELHSLDGVPPVSRSCKEYALSPFLPSESVATVCVYDEMQSDSISVCSMEAIVAMQSFYLNIFCLCFPNILPFKTCQVKRVCRYKTGPTNTNKEEEAQIMPSFLVDQVCFALYIPVSECIEGQNCAYAHRFSAVPAIACPSAKDHPVSIAPAAHAPMCRAANRAANHATNRAVGPTPVRVVTSHAANQIAHPVVRAAARAANPTAARAANPTAARAATAIRHVANPTANPTAARFATAIRHVANPTAAASSSSAAQTAAPAASQAAPAATPVAVASSAAHVPAAASQAAAVSERNVAASRNAAPALALGAPAASVASRPSNALACSGAAPASSASTASHRAARARLPAASASRRAARGERETVAAAAGGHAAVFRSRRALGVPAGVFGRAESVQKVVDVLGAGIRAVPLDACVEFDSFLSLVAFLFGRYYVGFGFVRTLYML